MNAIYSVTLLLGVLFPRYEQHMSTAQYETLAQVASIASPHARTKILILAFKESNFSKDAISSTGDYGVMQINCKSHLKRLRESLGVQVCNDLLDVRTNIRAAEQLLEEFATSSNCRGAGLFTCYNGGPSWNSGTSECVEDSTDKICKKFFAVTRYGKDIKNKEAILRRIIPHLMQTVPRQTLAGQKARFANVLFSKRHPTARFLRYS